jgi:hypothetical protein
MQQTPLKAIFSSTEFSNTKPMITTALMRFCSVLALIVLSLPLANRDLSADISARPSLEKLDPLQQRRAVAKSLKRRIDEGIRYLRSEFESGELDIETQAISMYAVLNCHRKYGYRDGPWIRKAIDALFANQWLRSAKKEDSQSMIRELKQRLFTEQTQYSPEMMTYQRILGQEAVSRSMSQQEQWLKLVEDLLDKQQDGGAWLPSTEHQASKAAATAWTLVILESMKESYP